MNKQSLFDRLMQWLGWVRVDVWESALRCVDDRDETIAALDSSRCPACRSRQTPHAMKVEMMESLLRPAVKIDMSGPPRAIPNKTPRGTG